MANQIKSFNRATIVTLRTELAKAVASVEAAYGIKVDFGNARFTDSTVTFKTNVAIPIAIAGQATAVTDSMDANNYIRYQWSHHLPTAALGKVVRVNGETYRIKGYMPRKPKYPILAERVFDNRRFKFAVSTIASAVQVAGIN